MESVEFYYHFSHDSWLPDMTWKGVGPNATQRDLKRNSKFPNYKSPGLLLKNFRNGMYGLLCEFGKWLWTVAKMFVILEFLLRNSSDFVRNRSGQFRNRSDLTFWRRHWGASWNPWNLYEIGNPRPKRMTCFWMPSQETHSARVWQGCLGPEMYITCVCCPHSGPVMLVWCW